MTSILVIRDKIRHILNDYETWVQIACKFVGMFFVFSYINSTLTYYDVFNNPMINVLLALICSIIPGSFGVFIAAAIVCVQMVKLSVVLGLITVVVMLIIYLLFIVFSPEQSIVILAVPVLMHYNLHFCVPILAGMFLTPYAVVPAALGMFVVKFIGIEIGAVALTGTGMTVELDGITEAMSTIFTQSIAQNEVWLYLIVAAVTCAVIFVVKQFTFDYALYISIIAGAIVEIVAIFFLEGIFATGLSISVALFGVLIGAAIALVVQFFKCPLDYKRKEYVQFEDDDYYYYVKAVPKYETDTKPVEETVKKSLLKKQKKEDIDKE